MQTVFISLGSNLGDRNQQISMAFEMVAAAFGPVIAASSVYETSPWGIKDQPSFLNQCMSIETEVPAEEILRLLLSFEDALGRQRRGKWNSREIDIDVLFYGENIIETDQITIPHPSIHQRKFILTPLKEIAPDFTHPVLMKSITELESICTDDSLVAIYDGAESGPNVAHN